MEKNSNYELLYIVHPDLESSIDKITDRIKGAIESRGGKVNYEENWGKRKLAYPIRKSEVGIYILNYFSAPTESLAKLERDLRLTEEVMRFMVLSLPAELKKSKEATKKAPEKEEKKVQKETEVEAVAKEKAPKKSAKEEEARLKELDEKLDKILGDEEPKAEAKKPATKKASKDKKSEKE